jgi:hypothetical protein
MEGEQQPAQGIPGISSETQREGSPSPVSFARTRRHRPYFTPEEVAILSEKQRGGPTVSEGYEDRIRQQACGFMEAVGLRMGLYVRATYPVILRWSLRCAPSQSKEDYSDCTDALSSFPAFLSSERF